MSLPNDQRWMSQWVPIALRLPWRTPPGILLAAFALFVADRGWLGHPLGLSRPAELTLGIVVAAAVLWITEAVPLFVTSLLVLGLELVWLAPELARGGGSTLFLNAFFSDVTLLFLGGFVLSAGIERTGLARWVSEGILQRVGRSPTRVVLAMMVVTSLLGVWMSNTAACALMLGPATAMLRRVPEGDGFRKSLLVGIAFSANLSGLATPVSSPPNAIVMRYLTLEGVAPSFATWMALAVPLLIVLQLILLAYLRRLFPSRVKEIHLEERPNERFGGPQVLVLVVFLLTVLGWVFGAQLALTSGTVALLPVVAFFGTNLLRTADLRAMPWDVILLIGGGLALGAAVDQSGLAAWVGDFVPAGKVRPFLLTGIVAVFAVAMSSVMSNTAAVNLVTPIVMGFAGVDHALLLLVVAFACTLSMPLPMSTPPNVLAYGVSVHPDGRGELRARDMVVPGVLFTAVGLGMLALFSAFWFPLFGW